MRKSINVETVTSALVNTYRAKLWRGKVEELVKSVAVASTDYVNGYQQKLKGEIEFANANLELLSEEDYKWLLEQQKSSTDIIELPPKTHGVRETYNKSDTEIMDKFKSVLDKCATKNVDKSKSSNSEFSESQSTRWIVQITIGKDIYYRTLRTKNRMSPSIYDAKCYVSENAAKQAIVSVVAENASDSAMYFWAIAAKEVLCTETSSRTIEIVKKPKKSMDIDSPEFKKALASAPFVCKTHCDSEELPIVKKPVDSTVKKVRKPKKVYLIQDKKTKQYVTKVDHSNFTEVDLDKDISEARLYTSMGNADSDCKYLSRYKDKNCKAQLEVVEMPDDEKFVLWSNGPLEFFVRIDSTGIRTTKNIDEATRYVSYKSASTAVKKTDKELPYRFSFSTVKNVKPLVVPVEKPVKKVKEPKIKEEWVLYDVTTGKNLYYRGDSVTSSWYLTDKLEEAKKFPTYSSAVKVNYKLVNLGYANFSLSESKDFE